jgi:hypothetical protein
MYGYPEQFIPAPEYPGGGAALGTASAAPATATPAAATQMAADSPSGA